MLHSVATNCARLAVGGLGLEDVLEGAVCGAERGSGWGEWGTSETGEGTHFCAVMISFSRYCIADRDSGSSCQRLCLRRGTATTTWPHLCLLLEDGNVVLGLLVLRPQRVLDVVARLLDEPARGPPSSVSAWVHRRKRAGEGERDARAADAAVARGASRVAGEALYLAEGEGRELGVAVAGVELCADGGEGAGGVLAALLQLEEGLRWVGDGGEVGVGRDETGIEGEMRTDLSDVVTHGRQLETEGEVQEGRRIRGEGGSRESPSLSRVVAHLNS